MAENKLDKDGLDYSWRKIVGYIQTTFTLVGNTVMGTVANTVTGAIKELVDKIGNVTMGTTATTITGAIKEHQDLIGSETMGTTAETLTGAIAEHEDDINTLNSNLSNFVYSKRISDTTEKSSRTFSIPSQSRFFIIGTSSNTNRCFAFIVISYSSGAVNVAEVYKGSDVSYNNGTNNRLTISTTSAQAEYMVFGATSVNSVALV